MEGGVRLVFISARSLFAVASVGPVVVVVVVVP